MSTFRPASIGKTGILSIKKNGEQVSRYRPDLGDAEIDISSAEKTTTTGKFKTINGGKLESCIVGIAPKQNLHGYSKPWVGGSGKNLIPLTLENLIALNTTGTWSGNRYTFANGTIVDCLTDDDGNITGLKASGSHSASATFNFNLASFNFESGVLYKLNGITGGSSSTYRINVTDVGNYSDGDNSISGDGSSHTIRLQFFKNYTSPDFTVYPMLRLATETDATFAPYTNICGITGHTAVEVRNVGKNLYVGSPSFDGFANIGGWVKDSSNYNGHDVYKRNGSWNGMYKLIGLEEGIYTFSCMLKTDDSANVNLYAIANNVTTATINPTYKSNIETSSSWRKVSFTFEVTTAGTVALRIERSDSNGYLYISEYQIEEGSTATEYAPYQGQDITISLGQTVYGGSLDVVSGVLTVDKGYTDLGSLTWTAQTTSVSGKNRFRTGDITSVDKKPSANNVVADISSSIYKAITAENTYFLNNEGVSLDTAGAILIYDSTKETLTAEQFKTAMNGAQLVYALATPTVIQLTPQQINTLIGENHLDVPLEGQTLDSAVYRELFAWDDVEEVVEDKFELVEQNGYLSIQRAFKEELGHSIYTYNTGIPTINNAYLGIRKKYPVKVGDVVYLKFETTSATPWYAITHYDSNGNYTGVLKQGYGTEAKIPISYSGFVSFVIWTSNSEFLPSTVSEFKFFTHYVPDNSELANGSARDNTKLPLSGGTMTGQIKTSFKSSVAMGSYASAINNIPDFINEVRFSSGCSGSVYITSAYTKDDVTVPISWYNFLWIPHRSGGANGNPVGDNCNYGNCILTGMTGSGAYILRVADATIQEVKDLYKSYNFNGVRFESGDANVSSHDANSVIYNGMYYYTSNGPSQALGATQTYGALYTQAFSSNWVGEIAQDYHDGDLFTRGKKNGVWQPWKSVAYKNEVYDESTDNEPYTLRQGKGDMVDMELVGGSFAWNQLVYNGNFASTSGWTKNVSSTQISASNNVLTIIADSNNGGVYQYMNGSANIVGHKVLFLADVKCTDNAKIGTNNTTAVNISASANYQKIGFIQQISNSARDAVIIYSRVNSSNTIDVRNVMYKDLTQDMGSSVADAIYAMEQATSGSGVAFFRKYFPKDYYAYDTGSIQSVCVSGRKVVGKNLLDISNLEQGGIDANGINVASTTRIRMINRIKVEPNTYYVVNAKPSGSGTASNALYYYDSNGTFISSLGWNDSLPKTFQTPVNCAQIRATFRYTDNSTVIVESFKELQIEKGSTATAYEPYEEYVYPMPNEQLRGIPSLVNNKLVYDGDIWNAKGIIRKYGIVDLGTLNYSRAISSGLVYYFYIDLATTSLPLKIETFPTKTNILCPLYTAKSNNNNIAGALTYDMQMCRNQANLCIRNDSYTDPTAFKTAMSGVYLVYELATPTIESAEPYQNPQRAFANGTEEFIDGLTRDVIVPVGHNSTYKSSEVIQPLEDYVDGASADLDNKVQEKVAKTDIADNLTTNDATKVLSAKQGKALQDGKINVSDRGKTVFNVQRGGSQTTRTSGYWARMLNSESSGNPTLPTSGLWWHVLSMDWDDNTIDSWLSQLAIATKDGSGVWWRRNDGNNVSIENSTWHRLAEGDADGNAIGVDKLYKSGSFTSSTSASTTVTATNSAISISSTTPIDVYSDVFGLNVESISVSGSGTSATISITFPKTESAQTINYRVYVKTI